MNFFLFFIFFISIVIFLPYIYYSNKLESPSNIVKPEYGKLAGLINGKLFYQEFKPANPIGQTIV